MTVSSIEEPVNVLTATAFELQEKLSNSTLTSVDLVNIYLEQIKNHNRDGFRLNAVISSPPVDHVLSLAAELDRERAEGRVRSPLHGIPILLKDNIMTEESLGMDTTCGAYAFVGVKAKKSAPIVDKIREAGMIIIGKANLSEWAGFKGYGIPGGFSAVGGQTQTPYVPGGYKQGDRMIGHSNCCGSSSGSAAGVAAGFAPLAIGTEDDGSIVQPSGRCSLYGLKITVGDVSTEGTSPLSPFTDSLGPIGRSPEDLSALLGILLQRDFSSSLTRSWEGLKVGFVDPSIWYIREGPWEFVQTIMDQEFADILDAQELIAEGGAKVVGNVPLISYDVLQYNGSDGLDQIWNHDFARHFPSFVAGYLDPPIKTVEDLVKFNFENAEKALPGGFEKPQGLLEDSIEKKDDLSPDKYEEAKAFIRHKARVEGYDRAFKDYDIDILAGPLDSRMGSIAAAAGLPSATVPLGYADFYNGRAYGLSIIAGAGNEEKLVQFMSAWSASHPGLPKPPPQMANAKDSSL